MSRSRDKGTAVEDWACTYLEQQGLKVVERNFRTRQGEIDLVMSDGGQLVFVEVRYRNSSRFGGALESVDRRKRARLVAAANSYLSVRGFTGSARFDVVAVERTDRVQWITNAFDAA